MSRSAAALTAFGEGGGRHAFFTGKPLAEGLGRAFLMRNYRADLAKWQTADPLGYPDGWNPLAYGINSPVTGIDLIGAAWGNMEMVMYYFRYAPAGDLATSFLTFLTQLGISIDDIDTDVMGLTDSIYWAMIVDGKRAVNAYVASNIPGMSGNDSTCNFRFGVGCEHIVFALGSGSGSFLDSIEWTWYTEFEWIGNHLYERKHFNWSYFGRMRYRDSFEDPVDVLNWLKEPNIEVPGGVPYQYGHLWESVPLSGEGVISRLLE